MASPFNLVARDRNAWVGYSTAVGIGRGFKTIMSDYSAMRILVLRENWLGCTGLSAFGAYLRMGCQVSSISDTDYFSSHSGTLFSRAVAKLIRPLGVYEFNQALLKLALDVKPHLFLAVKGAFIQAQTLRAMRRA